MDGGPTQQTHVSRQLQMCMNFCADYALSGRVPQVWTWEAAQGGYVEIVSQSASLHRCLLPGLVFGMHGPLQVNNVSEGSMGTLTLVHECSNVSFNFTCRESPP